MARWFEVGMICWALVACVEGHRYASVFYQSTRDDVVAIPAIPTLSPPEVNAVLSHRLYLGRYEAISPAFRYPHLLQRERTTTTSDSHLVILHTAKTLPDLKHGQRLAFEVGQVPVVPSEAAFTALLKTYNERYAETRGTREHSPRDQMPSHWLASSSSSAEDVIDWRAPVKGDKAFVAVRTSSQADLDHYYKNAGDATVTLVVLHDDPRYDAAKGRLQRMQDRLTSLLPAPASSRKGRNRRRSIALDPLRPFSTRQWRRDQDALLTQSQIQKRQLTPKSLCFTSEDEVSKATKNCTGHGKPARAEVPIPYESGLDCFVCQCEPTIDRASGAAKTTYWTGSACEKRDVSGPFNLLFWSSLILLITVGLTIKLLVSVGSDALPNQLSAGVAPPKRD